MEAVVLAKDIYSGWCDGLPERKRKSGPPRGSIAASLVVLERLKSEYDLDLDSHRAEGKAQIRGLGKESVKKILERYGETRPFLEEGGRTNRGAPGDVAILLEVLKKAKLDVIAENERNEVIDGLQEILVERVVEFHKKKRIKMVYDAGASTWQLISNLMEAAREVGKEGQVAQYLVGAKLQIRFPGQDIENLSYSTADDQLGRPGDFYFGDTAFHVTVAPMPNVYDKCIRNVQAGYRPFLLVPERLLTGVKQNADLVANGKIATYSIESFIAQNLEELSGFTRGDIKSGLLLLLETYNSRVDAIENDKSMLIEIPQNLLA